MPVDVGHFTLLPGNQDLVAAEVQLMSMIGREVRLRNALKPVRNLYDVIIIDCPPALNLLTLNALVAADSVLVPMQCEYYALEGLSALMQHHRADQGEREPRPRGRRHPAHHVRPAQQPVERGLRAAAACTSATRCSAR